jgi:hypothetical protein
MREFRILGCVDQLGAVRRKFILTKVAADDIATDVAIDNNFTMTADDQDHWVREVTDDVIAAETRHENWDRLVLHDGTVRLLPNGTMEQHPDFPADCTFKDAWRYSGTSIVHDISTARAVVRREIRRVRSSRWPALDTAYQRATESGDEAAVASLLAQKNTLRDAPENPAIDAAETIEQLSILLNDWRDGP